MPMAWRTKLIQNNFPASNPTQAKPSQAPLLFPPLSAHCFSQLNCCHVPLTGLTGRSTETMVSGMHGGGVQFNPLRYQRNFGGTLAPLLYHTVPSSIRPTTFGTSCTGITNRIERSEVLGFQFHARLECFLP